MYTYVGNDPTNASDPSGRSKIKEHQEYKRRRDERKAKREAAKNGTVITGSKIGSRERIKSVDANLRVASDQKGYDDPDQAAEAFFNQTDGKRQEAGNGEEVVGAIVKGSDGKYRPTNGVIVPAKFRAVIKLVNDGGHGGRITAVAHTHPKGGGEVFSAEDIATARGRPFYLRTPSGKLLVLKPKKARRDEGRGRSPGENACPASSDDAPRPERCLGAYN